MELPVIWVLRSDVASQEAQNSRIHFLANIKLFCFKEARLIKTKPLYDFSHIL